MSSSTIGDLVFAKDGLWGLSPEFLQNLLAEGVGTVLGIVISVTVAVWLDRQREAKRHTDHRGRAVTRWVKSHADMIDGIAVELSHGEGVVHRTRAQALVTEAERDAADIKADYASALDKKAISIAFEEYVRALNSTSTYLSSGEVDILQLVVLLDMATDKLKSLVRAAGARRSILQTEPLFAGLPKEFSATKN